MSVGYIVNTAEGFFKALDGAHVKLEEFSQILGNNNAAIFAALKKFAKDCASVRTDNGKSAEQHTAVDELLSGSLIQIQEAIQKWHTTLEDNKKGQQFMQDHEKYIVIMVFGAVKSGKSTLGNILAGREWLKASFDNEYKRRYACEAEYAQFATQEKGRDTGDTEKDENGRSWFSEGVTDTTGDIQYFSLSGLRWFDSPGTGALAKEGDKFDMEEKVKNYLQYVDICIFLVNSSEPGLQEDMKYIDLLNRSEQEAVVVITKSDVTKLRSGKNGEKIKIYSAKSREVRKLQEDDMLRRLKEAYPRIDAKKFHAMSLSALIARQALEQGDEQLFKDSRLDELMNRIRDKASADVVSLKKQRPRKAMNLFIQSILEGDTEVAGIKDLDKALSSIIDEADKYKKTIGERTDRIVNRISRTVKTHVEILLGRLARETAANGREYSGSEISQEIYGITQPIIVGEIRQEVSKILSESGQILHDIAVNVAEPPIKTNGIRQRTESFTQTVTYYGVSERDPDGVWENFCSFFGKRYYRQRTYTKDVTHTYNAGSNRDEVLENVMPQIEKYAQQTVRDNLESIAENYFLPQQRYVSGMRDKLAELRKQLESYRL